MQRPRRALALCSALALVPVARTAHAQAPSDSPAAAPRQVPGGAPAAPPSSDDRATAAHEFKDGERAFQRGDFEGAAKLFESAYRHAPHHAPLWNAARAWERAKNLPRAATLYAKFLRDAPGNASGRDSANIALRELSKKLARFEIAAPGMTDLQIDAQPTDESIVYVTPGTHTIDARQDDRAIHHSQEAVAGITVGIALVAPTSTVPASPTSTATPPPAATTTLPPPASTTPEPASSAAAPANPDQPSMSPRTGLPPYVVIVGGALTAIGLAATIASGVDTQNWKSDHYDVSPTQSNLDQGFAREHRTNILLGATLAAAALTGVAAIWLVDWHGGSSTGAHATGIRVGVGAGPGSVIARGSF